MSLSIWNKNVLSRAKIDKYDTLKEHKEMIHPALYGRPLSNFDGQNPMVYFTC